MRRLPLALLLMLCGCAPKPPARTQATWPRVPRSESPQPLSPQQGQHLLCAWYATNGAIESRQPIHALVSTPPGSLFGSPSDVHTPAGAYDGYEVEIVLWVLPVPGDPTLI
jgi:hypothetical protein